jgi:hypothetical protein
MDSAIELVGANRRVSNKVLEDARRDAAVEGDSDPSGGDGPKGVLGRQGMGHFAHGERVEGQPEDSGDFCSHGHSAAREPDDDRRRCGTRQPFCEHATCICAIAEACLSHRDPRSSLGRGLTRTFPGAPGSAPPTNEI